MISGFSFSKIVIIQSLEDHESPTGKILSSYVEAQLTEHNHQLSLEFLECSSYLEFLEILEKLTIEASTAGETPLLHVECHGDLKEGLEFENGSTLSWPDLAAALLQLNIACRFNLLSVFSACFGGHFLGQMGVINPAPCWCIVAPTETVDPGEIMQGLRTFYATLLTTSDAGKAVSAISKMPLSNGKWFGQPAETWFETVVKNYITTHCTQKATRERVKKLRRGLRHDGHQLKSIGSITRELCRLNRENLQGKYFDAYFLTYEIPENMQRFAHARVRLNLWLESFRDTKKYCL